MLLQFPSFLQYKLQVLNDNTDDNKTSNSNSQNNITSPILSHTLLDSIVPNSSSDAGVSATDIGRINFDNFLASTGTTAFIVIKDDKVLYEKYFNGYQRDSINTFFF